MFSKKRINFYFNFSRAFEWEHILVEISKKIDVKINRCLTYKLFDE